MSQRALWRYRLRNLFWIAFLAIGVIVAADRSYLKNVDDIERVIEAGLAMLLWPLVLLNVSMRI